MELTGNSLVKKGGYLIKVGFIAVIALLLQIPSVWIESIINERSKRHDDVEQEISGKWAKEQTITAPILVIPFTVPVSGGKQNTRDELCLLPDQLTINAAVNAITKHRGIFEAILYSSKAKISAAFRREDVSNIFPAEATPLWSECYLRVHVTDMRGIDSSVIITSAGTQSVLAPLPKLPAALFTVFPLSSAESLRHLDLEFTINLSGSKQLQFTPVGKETQLTVTSNWPDPSFTGNFLPQNSSVTKKGFTASWVSMSNRGNFPQYWTGTEFQAYTDSNSVQSGNSLAKNAIGIQLYQAVDIYRETTRTVKYSLLLILMTFAAIFIVEVIGKKNIHPVHYALTGFALVLFYSLLLSLAEYTGFTIAYVTAAAATISLIAWFLRSLLSSTKLLLVTVVVLVILYSYVFFILRLDDYSLLLGSISLFIALAAVMAVSKKIKW